MSNALFNQMTSLATILLIAWLVWRFYRSKTYLPYQRYSTFAPRFWAGPVDSCVLWPIGFVSTMLISFGLPRVLTALLVVAESIAWLFYTVLMHARYGQTIGKMVAKVRVVDYRTQGKISIRQAWLREGIPAVAGLSLLCWEVFAILTGRLSSEEIANGDLSFDNAFWLINALPGLWFVAEVVTMLTNEKRRALHDFIAGTVVVRLNISGETTPEDALAVPAT